jgi:type II secretory pathway component HofQ
MPNNAPAWEKKFREKIEKHIPKLDFEDNELGSVMLFLQETSGVNILLGEGVDKTVKVSLHVVDVTYEQALDLISQMHRFQYRLTENGLVFEKFTPAK